MDAAPPLPLSKPSRSEVEAPDPSEQRRISAQVRLKFETEAPQRHSKPCRSEPESSLSSVIQAAEVDLPVTPIPELIKFQALTRDAMAQPLCADFPKLESEEFMETDYYKHLNAVDKKLHYRTGSGFIQADSTSVADCTSVVHESKLRSLDAGAFVRSWSYCNPATNDWIPSQDSADIIASNHLPSVLVSNFQDSRNCSGTGIYFYNKRLAWINFHQQRCCSDNNVKLLKA